MSERFLVTGAAGQDGTYLVQRLLSEGVEVHGLVHTEETLEQLLLRNPAAIGHRGDLADGSGLSRLIAEVEPTHIVNLAGLTSVAKSWASPVLAADVLGVGPVRLLEAARAAGEAGRPVRVVQASSAEIFGRAGESPQTEATPLAPVSPYGAAKAFAHMSVGVFRAQGLFASSAILYNHESPERPETFVSRKITKAVARIALGLPGDLALGNLDSERDWGYAPDVVDALIRIARADRPGDFIVATGEAHPVRDFVRAAFAHIGIRDWESHVTIDPALFRPAESGRQVGDPTRLRALGWRSSVDFQGLVGLMVESDIQRLRAE